MAAFVIHEAHTVEHLPAVRELLDEYWRSFGFTPCFQNFAQELQNLPGAYAPPNGRLGIATTESDVAGCVAFRRLDESRCEAKRLYVRPRYRGLGVGRALLTWLINEARGAGYHEVVCDTMADTMQDALAMYGRHGFERIESYSAEPTPGAVYLRCRL